MFDLGAYNRWGKHISFSFLNQDCAEKDEEDEKNTLNSSSSSFSSFSALCCEFN